MSVKLDEVILGPASNDCCLHSTKERKMQTPRHPGKKALREEGGGWSGAKRSHVHDCQQPRS